MLRGERVFRPLTKGEEDRSTRCSRLLEMQKDVAMIQSLPNAKVASSTPNAEGKNEIGYECTESCDVASHAHEDGLGSQLKGPKSNLLETPLTGFIIYDVSCKRIIGLSKGVSTNNSKINRRVRFDIHRRTLLPPFLLSHRSDAAVDQGRASPPHRPLATLFAL